MFFLRRLTIYKVWRKFLEVKYRITNILFQIFFYFILLLLFVSAFYDLNNLYWLGQYNLSFKASKWFSRNIQEWIIPISQQYIQYIYNIIICVNECTYHPKVDILVHPTAESDCGSLMSKYVCIVRAQEDNILTK